MKLKGDFLVSNEGSIPDTYHKGVVHGGRGKHGLGRNDEKIESVDSNDSRSSGFNFGIFGTILFFLILMLLGGVLFNGNNPPLADKVESYTYDIGHVTYNPYGHYDIDTGDKLQSLSSQKRLFKPLLNFANYWGEEFKSVAKNIQLKTLVINDSDESGVVLAKSIANFFIQLGTFISQIVVYVFYVVRMVVSFIMFIFRGYVNTFYLGGING